MDNYDMEDYDYDMEKVCSNNTLKQASSEIVSFVGDLLGPGAPLLEGFAGVSNSPVRIHGERSI